MYLFAPVRSTEFPNLDGLVIFELRDSQGEPVYLEIRFFSFDERLVEGDHLYVESADVVKKEVEATYEIDPSTWRNLTSTEVGEIGQLIA